MLGKKLSPDTFDQIINEFNDFIASDEETRKTTIKHLDNLMSKVSKVIKEVTENK